MRKPIRLMVGYSAGGGMDALARPYAAKLPELLKVPVIVENRPGASELLAAQPVMHAQPDDHTLWIGSGGALVQGPGVRTDLPYDPLKDFTPIALIADGEAVFLVKKEAPFNSMSDLIAYARANPGKLSYGSAGVGSGSHLTAEYILALTGASILHVPYKGEAESTRDAIGGNVDVTMAMVATAVPLIKDGKLKPIGITGLQRINSGAGSGIGAACVRRLYAEGAAVVAVDLDSRGIDALASELGSSDHIYSAALDVADPKQGAALFADAQKRFGSLHGLINCAGIKGVGNVLDCELENWKQVMSVNLDGTFLMCQAFARAVRDDKTSRAIVNISSGAGLMGVPNRLPYVASKFAVSGITRTMGAELGAYGIRVNAIAPGMIRTPFTAYMFEDAEKAKKIRAAHAIGREGQPEEIAAVAAFLLTDDASFMTGAVVSESESFSSKPN